MTTIFLIAGAFIVLLMLAKIVSDAHIAAAQREHLKKVAQTQGPGARCNFTNYGGSE